MQDEIFLGLTEFSPVSGKLLRFLPTLSFDILRDKGLMWHNVYIVMARTQITLDAEIQRRARQRASELGVSLAEYFRRLVARDLTRPKATIEVDGIFDLGNSGGSDIAKHKDSMIAESLDILRRRGQRP